LTSLILWIFLDSFANFDVHISLLLMTLDGKCGGREPSPHFHGSFQSFGGRCWLITGLLEGWVYQNSCQIWMLQASNSTIKARCFRPCSLHRASGWSSPFQECLSHACGQTNSSRSRMKYDCAPCVIPSCQSRNAPWVFLLP